MQLCWLKTAVLKTADNLGRVISATCNSCCDFGGRTENSSLDHICAVTAVRNGYLSDFSRESL